MKSLIKKHPTISFLILCCLFSWACWLPIIEYLNHEIFNSSGLTITLFILGIYSPALIGILLCAIEGGVPAVFKLLEKLLIGDVAWYWYAIALIAPPLCLLLGVAFYTTRGGDIGWVNQQALYWLPYVFLFSIAFGPFAEELGWRGKALPPLLARYGFIKSSLLMGLMYTLWHTPLFWAATGTVISGLPLSGFNIVYYLLAITALSFFYTYLYQHTGGSVLLTSLLHLSANVSFPAMLFILPELGRSETQQIWQISIWFSWLIISLYLIVTLLSRRYPKDKHHLQHTAKG